MNKTAAIITVEWGYESHSLHLDKEDWQDVLSGEELSFDGPGYDYEGGEYSDYWRFKGGVGGELKVYYSGDEEGSEGEGYLGSLTEDMIELKP
jgi:hypothetical protein